MKNFLRFISGLIISLFSAVVAVEIHIQAHVYESGTTRADHSDDYGMAFYGLIIGVAVFFVVSILCWNYFGKQYNKDIKNNK